VAKQLKLPVGRVLTAGPDADYIELQDAESLRVDVDSVVVEREDEVTTNQRESAAFEGSVFRSIPAQSASASAGASAD